ncbi:MAG TPA: hypothetical protein VKE74_09770, partial [Gemmataceae bacterium]|nr:hypothetical protein [Gemmataceae bacterium]
MPDALARKYPGMDREWGWQWVFPASSHSTDPRTGVRHRHHLHESVTAHPAAGRAISNPRLAPATSPRQAAASSANAASTRHRPRSNSATWTAVTAAGRLVSTRTSWSP